MGQPSHWTYCSFVRTDDLQQGDIVSRSPALLEVLSKVLSYFCDDRYTAFLVTTQSCDLVRRGGPCKAEHINLCVVRELRPFLPTLLDSCGVRDVPGVFLSENRRYAEQLLTRVINQNEQSRGLFYLHTDADAGIVTPSVAMLRVSIALRREHYELLREYRCGRLGAEYAAKLGWLSGNLYSRVATRDWEEQQGDHEASKKQVQSLLALVSSSGNENWIPQEVLNAAKAAGVDLLAIPPNRFRSALKEYNPPGLIEVVLESVRRTGCAAMVNAAMNSISESLAANNEFIGQVVRQTSDSVAAILTPEERAALRDGLLADAEFRKSLGMHVAIQFKQELLKTGKQAIDGLSAILEGLVGLPSEAGGRMQFLVSTLFSGEDDKIRRVLDLIAVIHPFNRAACGIAQAVGKTTLDRHDFTIFDSLVSRLRNDQRLKAACRASSRD
jgi:hypothetical protein